jgi:hypothetical protein
LRIRITRPRHGELDGVELDTFAVGLTYEVSSSLGTYLVTTDSAVIVGADEPVSGLPMNDIRFERFIERARHVVAERNAKPIAAKRVGGRTAGQRSTPGDSRR